MADRRERHVVELRVDAAQFARQIDSMDKNLVNLNRTASNVQRSFSGFTRGLGGLATIGVGLHTLTQAFDKLSQIQTVNNQLKTVADSMGELNAMQDALLASANEARAPYEQMVTLFTRLTRATDTLGLSQQQVLQVTENVAKSLAVGGANAKETASSMYQLSQAFASNRLAGDEFRSLSENMPQLLIILSKHLNVTIGELKKLGSEGKLTGEVLSEALLGATTQINEAFGKTNVTLGQALTVLDNQISAIIQHFEESTGVLADVASYMVQLSEDTKLVEAALLGVTVLVTGAMAAGFLALVATLGLVGVAVAAVSAAVAAAYYYWDDLIDIAHEVDKFFRYDLVEGLERFALDFEQQFEEMGRILDIFLNLAIDMWNGFKEYAAEAINAIINELNPLLEAIHAPLLNLVEFEKTAHIQVQSVAEIEAKYNDLKQAVTDWAKTNKAAYDAAIMQQKALDDEIKKFKNTLPGLSDVPGTKKTSPIGVDPKAEKALQKAADKLFDDTQKALDKLFDEAMKRAEAHAKEVEKQTDAYENLRASLDDVYAAQKQFDEGAQVLFDAFSLGLIDLQTYLDLLDKLREKTEYISPLMQEIGDTIDSVFQDAANAVTDFVFESTGSIKDMIRDWEKQLLNFTLSSAFQAVADAFKNLLKGASGGGVGSGGGIFDSLFNFGFGLASANGNVFHQGHAIAMKKGGLVRKPSVMAMANGGIATVAEEGTEAVMPLVRGPDGKLGVASSGSDRTTVIVNNNVPGATATAVETSGPGGEKMVEVMVQKAVTKGFGTGAFDKVMRSNFGVTREGRR